MQDHEDKPRSRQGEMEIGTDKTKNGSQEVDESRIANGKNHCKDCWDGTA